jgi:SAM-dependent methyltransferase
MQRALIFLLNGTEQSGSCQRISNQMRNSAILIALFALASAQEHPRIDPQRIHRFQRQEIEVHDFPAEGWILDVGGGGEGIIGRIKGSQVVAIDLYARELKGTPPGPLKIVMDATKLGFLDSSFRTATCFFSLMYMGEDIQEKVFQELARVLEPGGRLHIWEVVIPTRLDPAKDVALFPFLFRLPGEEVETGYGTFFPGRNHDAEYFKAVAGKSGFSVVSSRAQASSFYLELKRL